MHTKNVLQGVHAQGNVHSRAVGEESSQRSLNEQAEDEDSVPVDHKKGWGLKNESSNSS